MKRIMMVGAILLLSAAAARAQDLELPDVKAKPVGAKKPAPKGDPLDLPSIDAKPTAKDAKAAKDTLDLGGLDALQAKDAKKDAAKAAGAAAPTTTTTSATGAAKDAKAGAAATTTVTTTTTGAAGAGTKAIVADKVTVETKEKAGTAAPAMGMTAQVGPPPRTDQGPWGVGLLAGAERGGERYLDGNTSLTRLGLQGAWNFSGAWALLGAFDFRSSAQGYVINRPSDTGQPRPPVLLDEQRYDFRLGLGYDAGPKILENRRLVLQPGLGLRVLTLQNQAFPTSFVGPEVSVRSSSELSRAVVVQGTLDYAFNFAESTTQSAVGAPKGHLGWSAGLALPLDGGFALEFNYVGDLLAFRNVYRVAHGGALGFSTTF